MKLLITAVLAACLTSLSKAEDRELPPVIVHEWGVLSWSGPGLIFSGAPQSPAPLPDTDGMMLRAPVLYIHGPEFTGTVIVRTDNGLISEVYPEASDGGVTREFCSWTGAFSYDFDHTSPGEMAAVVDERRSLFTVPRWPLQLWRTGESMTVITSCATESFLYHETKPDDLGFLPCLQGGGTVADEWASIPAIVVKWSSGGAVYARCSLGNIRGQTDSSFMEMSPDHIHRTLREWSRDVIDVEEVDALWNTWMEWFCGDFIAGGSYPDGLVLYPVPESLLPGLSTIEVVPESPTAYPTRVRRLILAAVPL